MSLSLLVDALIREAAALVAASATHKGERTRLGGIEDKLFFGVAEELQSLDVKRRVAADMFGMAPRAYIRKVRRIEESATDLGRSVWAATYEFIVQREQVDWTEISHRFSRDDEEVLRGVLRDLTETGLVTVSGRANATRYEAVRADVADMALGRHATREFLWALIYRDGPISRAELGRQVSLRSEELDDALAHLRAAGRVTLDESSGEPVYGSEVFSPDKASREGWEGAIFDHFHAVVKTLSTYLIHPELGASAASTYTFDLTADHPLADKVKDLFVDMRARASELRKEIDTYNLEHPREGTQRTILYLGMSRDVPKPDRTALSEAPPPGDD